MGISEQRRYDRLLCAGLVDVRWSDANGYPCETVANLDNLSPDGACLLLDSPIPAGTRVGIGHLMCQVEAEIRFCSGSELGWVVGAQFLTGKTPGSFTPSTGGMKTVPPTLSTSESYGCTLPSAEVTVFFSMSTPVTLVPVRTLMFRSLA